MFHEIYLIESHFRLCIVSLIDVKPSRITTAIFVSQNNEMAAQGRIKGGGTLGKCQGPRAFGGPRRFYGPRGCLWRHVFRDRTARFWADILYMYRGAGAPSSNIKYESRTFLCN